MSPYSDSAVSLGAGGKGSLVLMVGLSGFGEGLISGLIGSAASGTGSISGEGIAGRGLLSDGLAGTDSTGMSIGTCCDIYRV